MVSKTLKLIIKVVWSIFGKSYLLLYFWNQKCQKMRYQPKKVQKYWKSKNGDKTAQTPLFKKLWAIFGKSDLSVYY